jgi:serine protease AprX
MGQRAHGVSWGKRRAVVAGVVAILTVLGAVVAPVARATDPPPATIPPSTSVDVIVRRDPGAPIDLDALVASVGGTVRQALPLINGVAATVPEGQVGHLEVQPGIVEVTADSALTLDVPSPTTGWTSGNAAFDFVEQDFGKAHGGSSFSSLTSDNLAEVTGADKAWRSATGKGVDVALIDSGVLPVAGMGAVVNGPDLSFDSQSPELRHLDAFGHGTHLAGIINGNGDGVRGLAPDARLVNVKVAAANGAADVSQVIAAIDWVVQNRDRNGLNIRVLALAFGTDGIQRYDLDPLAYAAEVAWRKGIVVVVSAGNQGATVTSLTNPAQDPFVIAVGASEPHGTFTTGDDTVAEFTNRGSSARGVDLVAPGRSLVSLRAPGSFIDQRHPEGRVGDRFFRGSGTSQSAAVVAAAAALVLEEHPSYSPDDVKWTLRKTAKSLPMADRQAQGSGAVDLRRAVEAPIASGVDTTQRWAPSTGTGSLDAARGTYRISQDGVVLDGERDIFGTPWDGVSWSGVSWSGVSWSGGEWNGVSWSGSGWGGVSWSGVSWSGVSWSGVSWSGVSWSGVSWSGVSWSGVSWSGVSWSGVSWSGVSWSSHSAV